MHCRILARGWVGGRRSPAALVAQDKERIEIRYVCAVQMVRVASADVLTHRDC